MHIPFFFIFIRLNYFFFYSKSLTNFGYAPPACPARKILPSSSIVDRNVSEPPASTALTYCIALNLSSIFIINYINKIIKNSVAELSDYKILEKNLNEKALPTIEYENITLKNGYGISLFVYFNINIITKIHI